MSLTSKDKRLIATAALTETEPDSRTAKERVLDSIGNSADDNGWMWNQLAPDSEYDFELQSGRETISVKLDNDGNLETATRTFAINSDGELYAAIARKD